MLWVGFGGFIGSAARYGVTRLFHIYDATSFPYSTLSVNILGSFFLGFLSEYFLEMKGINQGFALFITVGICGGFTTFSSFSLENIQLLRSGQYLPALTYIIISIVGSLIFFIAGMKIASSI